MCVKGKLWFGDQLMDVTQCLYLACTLTGCYVLLVSLSGLLHDNCLPKKYPFQVFEQSQELREAGAGLTLHANSLAALNHIDPALLKTVKKHSLEPDLLRITDHRGRVFSALKNHQLINRYGYSTVVVHRGELLHSFSEFAKSMRSGPEIVTRSQVVDIQFDPNGKTMTVILAAGSQEEAGLIIGADGLHSIIREKIHGM